jgi:hypothetical protein
MSRQQLTGPDAARSYLRSVVDAVDHIISHLDEAGTGESCGRIDQLRERWKELVSLLALGSEPEYRECPSCRSTGMRSATKCGFCWIKLPPFIPPLEAPGEKLQVSESLISTD